MEKLKKLREQKKYTYNDMAKLLKISKPYYWQIENNKRGLSYQMAVNISHIFNLKPDEIFLDEVLTNNKNKE